MFNPQDRVQETTTSTGTGDITTAGAITGFRTFGSVLSVGDVFPYFINEVDADGIPDGDWESGIGTYTATNTVERTLVIASSNSNNAVNFATGDKRIAISPNAFSTRPAHASIETVTGTSDNLDPDKAGLYRRYTSDQAKTLVILDEPSGGYIAGMQWSIRCENAGLTISPVSGVQVNPPYGGTLDLLDGMTVQLVYLGNEHFDLIGQTVPA